MILSYAFLGTIYSFLDTMLLLSSMLPLLAGIAEKECEVVMSPKKIAFPQKLM